MGIRESTQGVFFTDDSIHISSVQLPDGVRPSSKRDITITSIAGREAETTDSAMPAPAEVPTLADEKKAAEE